LGRSISGRSTDTPLSSASLEASTTLERTFGENALEEIIVEAHKYKSLLGNTR
jgi:hypothetical protein